jgi:hypothetical protein
MGILSWRLIAERMDDVFGCRIRLEVDAAIITLIEHEERTELQDDG